MRAHIFKPSPGELDNRKLVGTHTIESPSDILGHMFNFEGVCRVDDNGKKKQLFGEKRRTMYAYDYKDEVLLYAIIVE